MEFQEFPKMARLSREMTVTEKIDGTNAQIVIVAGTDAPEIVALQSDLAPFVVAADADRGLLMFAGSRSRYLTPAADNFGFAKWVQQHAADLFTLGAGRHFGEWWGQGIQRGYGLTEKRFSLFNVARWHAVGATPYMSVSADPRIAPKSSTEAPTCCAVVPVLYRGEFSTDQIAGELNNLQILGSVAASGFMRPEGVVVFHAASGQMFKKTIEKDAEPKSKYVRAEAIA